MIRCLLLCLVVVLLAGVSAMAMDSDDFLEVNVGDIVTIETEGIEDQCIVCFTVNDSAMLGSINPQKPFYRLVHYSEMDRNYIREDTIKRLQAALRLANERLSYIESRVRLLLAFIDNGG